MKSILTSIALFSTLISASAMANIGDQFTCSPVDTGTNGEVTLKIISRTEVSVDEDEATIDAKYDPRLNTGYLLFDYKHSDEGQSEVLVQRGLLYNATHGSIKIQNRGEGFMSDKYSCVQK